MKPAKKQNGDSNNNEKQISDKTQKSKIKTYFKSAPKSFVVEDRIMTPGGSKDKTKEFYVRMLKEKLQNINGTKDSNQQAADACGACAVVDKEDEHASVATNKTQINPDCGDPNEKCEKSKCVQKSIECDEWEAKYKELKKLYIKATMHHSEVELKYSDLLKTATGKNHERSGDGTADTKPTSNDIFTPNELKFLECMSLEKKKDSTFIHQCLQFAYKGDEAVLVFKSLKGTSDWIEITEAGDEKHHPAKDPLSPHKVNRIKEVFIERVSKCDINSVHYCERVKDSYINKLFASGIKNISKKQH